MITWLQKSKEFLGNIFNSKKDENINEVEVIINNDIALYNQNKIIYNFDNRYKLLEEIKKDGRNFKYADDDLKHNKEFLLDVVYFGGYSAFEYVPLDLKQKYSIEDTIEFIDNLKLDLKKEFLNKVKSNSYHFEHLPVEFKSDKEFILEIININPWTFYHLSLDQQSDYDITLAAVLKDGLTLQYTSQELKNNPSIVLAAIKNNKWALRYASDDIQSSYDHFISSIIFNLENKVNKIDDDIIDISINDDDLYDNSTEIYINNYITMNDIKEDNIIYDDKNDEFLNPSDFYVSEYSNDDKIEIDNSNNINELGNNIQPNINELGYEIKYTTKEEILKKEKYFQLKLRFASDELRNDVSLVLNEIKKNADSLMYVSKELRNDVSFLIKAIKIKKNCFKYINIKIKNIYGNTPEEFINNVENEINSSIDVLNNNSIQTNNINELVNELGCEVKYSNKDELLNVLKNNGLELKYASDELRADKDVVLLAIENRFSSFQYSKNLNNNKEFMLEVLKNKGYVLEFTSDNLKNDKDVVLIAVKNYIKSLRFASNELKIKYGNTYKKFITNVENEINSSNNVLNNKISIQPNINELGNEIKYSNKDELLILIKNDYINLQYASDELLNNKEFILECLKINGWCFNYVSNNLKDDTDIIINSLFKPNIYDKKDSIIETKQQDIKPIIKKDNLDTNKVLQIIPNTKNEYVSSNPYYNDYHTVIKGVAQDGLLLKFASGNLKDNPTIVKIAIKNNKDALQYASPRLQEIYKNTSNSKSSIIEDEDGFSF